MDFDGNLKEISNSNNRDYAIQYLNPVQNYTIVKMEFDQNSNEKKFICLLNESRMNDRMNSEFLIKKKRTSICNKPFSSHLFSFHFVHF